MPAFTPHIIASGPISPKQISITISNSNLVLTNQIEQRIDELWQQKEIEAQENGLNFFNGTSYRVNSYQFERGVLQLDLAVFDFKHRYGLITMSRNGEIDSTKLVQGGCFVGASVKTADDKYLMVKQSGKSALNINVYDVLGGMAETDVPCVDGNYFHDVLSQELQEEGNIEQSDIAHSTLAMVYRAINGHYGFYFEVTLTTSAEELLRRHQHNTDVDIDSLHAYSYENYLAKLKGHPSRNKQLIATHLQRKH